MSFFRDVLKFTDTFGCFRQKRPAFLQKATYKLRRRLIREEIGETLDAMKAYQLEHMAYMTPDDHAKHLAKIADGVADSIYVLLGTAAAYGIDMDRVWAEVHASNMRKVGGPNRADGKVLKPAGWVPPDVEGIIKSQWSGI